MPDTQGTIMLREKTLLNNIRVRYQEEGASAIGIPYWAGSFDFPADRPILAGTYRLILQDGKTAEIQVEKITSTRSGLRARFKGLGPLI